MQRENMDEVDYSREAFEINDYDLDRTRGALEHDSSIQTDEDYAKAINEIEKVKAERQRMIDAAHADALQEDILRRLNPDINPDYLDIDPELAARQSEEEFDREELLRQHYKKQELKALKHPEKVTDGHPIVNLEASKRSSGAAGFLTGRPLEGQSASDLESFRKNFSPEQLEALGKIRDAAKEMMDEYELHRGDYRWFVKNGWPDITVYEGESKDEKVSRSHNETLNYLKQLAFGTDFTLSKTKRLFSRGVGYEFEQASGVQNQPDWHYYGNDLVRALEKRAGVKIEDIFQ